MPRAFLEKLAPADRVLMKACTHNHLPNPFGHRNLRRRERIGGRMNTRGKISRIKGLPLDPAEALVLGDCVNLDRAADGFRQENGKYDEADCGLDQKTCEVDTHPENRHGGNGQRRI